MVVTFQGRPSLVFVHDQKAAKTNVGIHLPVIHDHVLLQAHGAPIRTAVVPKERLRPRSSAILNPKPLNFFASFYYFDKHF